MARTSSTPAARLRDVPTAAHSDVRLVEMSLQSIRYARIDGSVAETQEMDFFLTTAFVGSDKMITDFGVKSVTAGAVEVEIVYRALFQRESVPPDRANAELFWRTIAARVAPLVLMPYVRMAFSWATSQAGLPTLTLPLINPQGMLSPDEIEIPPLPDAVMEDESGEKRSPSSTSVGRRRKAPTR